MDATETLTQQQIDILLQAGRKDLLVKYHKALTPLERFVPRPDVPDDHDEQTGFINWKGKFAVCLGGTGSGKTHAAAVKTARYVLETPPPRISCPFWIIGETFEQVGSVCWTEKLAPLIPESEILTIHYHNKSRGLPHAVLLRHPKYRDRVGWSIEFKSYSQGRAHMQGYSIGGFWFNEECPMPIVEEVLGRCRDYNSPGWADFTPIEMVSGDWPAAYDEPKPGWKFFHLNVERNHAKHPVSDMTVAEWSKDFLATVPEDERETRRIGVFASFRGMVFKEFKKAVHVIDKLPTEDGKIPDDWYRIRGIDWGYSNPLCCLWVCVDKDGRFYVYDEHYERQKPNEYHVARIKEREWLTPHPMFGATYSDTADPQQAVEFTRLGVECTGANKGFGDFPVNARVSFLRSLMMIQGDGRPKLYILSKCRNLIKEIRGYHWSLPVGGDDRDNSPRTKNAPNQPVDFENHCLVGDTLVTTPAGLTRIDAVKVGDLALTRSGYQPVLWSGPTTRTRVDCITLSNGVQLRGTADHPVLCSRGWQPLGELRAGDELLCLEKICTPRPSGSYSLGCHTGVTQSPSVGNYECTSWDGAANDCTVRFGSTTGERYREGGTSTIATATHSITGSQTWNACRRSSTYPSTHCRHGHRHADDEQRHYCNPGSEPCTLGVEPRQAKPRQVKPPNSHGSVANWQHLPAHTAENLSSPSPSIQRSIAAELACLPPDVLAEWTMKLEFATSVACRLNATATAKPVVVPIRVACVQPGNVEQTYDLTVAESHEFFANGILVGNCIDALGYACYTHAMGKIRPPVAIRRPWAQREGIRFDIGTRGRRRA